MKINLKKVASVLASAVMFGSTLGFAAAAWAEPFVKDGVGDAAIVVGALATTDTIAATNLGTNLKAKVTESDSTVTVGDIKLTDDEVELRGLITGSDITVAAIADNKLSGLLDEQISWDDGEGSDDYDISETITIGTMKVLTTLDDKKLEGVALTNEKTLEYKLLIEDTMNVSAVGVDDADTLYLPIMGNEYEIEDMTLTSVTVTTSEQVSMTAGDTKTVAGKTVALVDVFDGSAEVTVDGKSEVINEGSTKKINGIRIHVESTGYHANTPETSKAILKVGEDISKTFESGDEFVGQDKDDPLWVWDIHDLGEANATIGVKYNADIDSANDDIAGDTIKYVGEGYVFPNNFAAVTLDSITDAKYENVKISFEDGVDLFPASDTSTALVENADVIVIEAENDNTITSAGKETDKLYIYYNATGSIQTFYQDIAGDYTPTNKVRAANLSVGRVNVNGTLDAQEVATLEIGDTNLDVDISTTTGVASLSITNDDAIAPTAKVLELTIGGTNLSITTGTFERLGTLVEDAQAGDVYFNATDVSTEEYDYMDTYGIKLSDGTTVKAEADVDEATLSVPEEQVYAQVTVSMGAVTTTSGSSEVRVFTDAEEASFKDKNLIVVGGSCINKAAAMILTGKTDAVCGDAFTSLTGVGVNKQLIQVAASPYNNLKLAMLVAGYEAADTTNAVNRVIDGQESTTVGSKVIYPLAI